MTAHGPLGTVEDAPTPPSRTRRTRTAAATLLTLLTVLLTVPPLEAAPEWRTMTGGIGWAPCQTITLRPNPAGGPASFLDDLGEAAGLINAAAGSDLLAVGPPTLTSGQDLTDDVFTVSFLDLPPSVAGTAWIQWTTVDGIPLEIVRGDIGLDGGMFAALPKAKRVGVIAHELGHALGLAHVGDAHEAMSNGFVYTGQLGPGTSQALQQLYGNGCGVGTVVPDSQDWALPAYNGVPASVSALQAGSSANDVEELGVALVGASIGRRGTGWASRAVVCRGDLFPDCLGGAALAGDDGPVLFVPGGAAGVLPPDVDSALSSALAPGATIYVLGGEQAVSRGIADALAARFGEVRRLSGPSRIETAVAVATEVVAVNGARGVALLARDDNPADAVTGGAAAGAKGLPILLTSKGSLHGATAAALAQLGITRTLLLGGPAALEPTVEQALHGAGRGPERVAGRTRSETSVAVARHPALWSLTQMGSTAAFVGLNGYHDETWALALAAAPLAAHEGAPILLTTADAVPGARPEDGQPGEPAWYLSHLTVAPGASPVRVTYFFVGVGRWADEHAAESFRSYLFIGL